jgi:hypothetical protein
MVSPCVYQPASRTSSVKLHARAAERGDVCYPYLIPYTVMAVPKTAGKKTNHERYVG